MCLQADLSRAVTSQLFWSMFKAFRSLLHTSLNRSCGLPMGRFPCASSPYRGKNRFKKNRFYITCCLVSLSSKFLIVLLRHSVKCRLLAMQLPDKKTRFRTHATSRQKAHADGNRTSAVSPFNLSSRNHIYIAKYLFTISDD